MGRFANFELAEFLRSATATSYGLDNTPTFEVVSHLEELVRDLLQPLRTAYGQSIRVTSGYRCQQLNRIVGGSRTSAHLTGYAADLQPMSRTVDHLISFAKRWLQDNDVPFDQCIEETGANGTRWLHLAIRNQDGEQRRQFKTISL